MKKFFTFIIVIIITGSFLSPFGNILLAQTDLENAVEDLNNAAIDGKIDTGTSIYQIVGIFINLFLSIIGLAFLVIVIIGGIQWMTAGGNQDKVLKSFLIMTRGAIGIIVILGALILVNFVVFKLLNIAF